MGKKANKEEPKKVAKVAPKKAVAKKSAVVKSVVTKSTKAAEKPVVKKPASKTVLKPEVKKTTSKVAVKPVAKKEVVKTVSKSIPKKTEAKKEATVKPKSIIKPEPKKPVEKKSIPEKTIPKNTEPVKTKTVAKSEPVKEVVKKATTPVAETSDKAETKKLTKKQKEQLPPPITVPRPSPDGKRKVIVDYKNVPDEVLGLLSEKYPHGYNKGIIKFTNAKKELVSAVPIDLGDTTYLVKVSTQLQKMVNDYDDDELFPEVVAPTEKEIPIGAGGDFDDFDKSDEDDGGKRKAKGRVKSADDLEYGFDDEDDDDGDDDDDDDDAASDDDGDDDDE